MPKKLIYLDYAASTPVDKKVIEKMQPFFNTAFGNPSSMHGFGREAEIAVDNARENIAQFFGVEDKEVYFTSGATEANNWIIHSTALQSEVGLPHIITTQIEHKSILEPIKALEKQGKVEATYLKPNKQGLICPDDVKKAIKKNTALITIGYVNNEIGVIQPLKEISKIINSYKLQAKKLQATSYKLFFHSDATQAINYLNCNLNKLGLDALSISAHKIYGPKGIGALIAKEHIKLEPLLYGGGQEQGLRSGTHNVSGIVGLSNAIEIIPNTKSLILNTNKLRKQLLNGIIKLYPKVKIVGSVESRVCNNISVIFSNIESQIMLIALDQAGIAVSSGSACQAKSVEPSHVLEALGYNRNNIMSVIRFTLGRYTTEKEIEYTISKLKEIIKKLKVNN